MEEPTAGIGSLPKNVSSWTPAPPDYTLQEAFAGQEVGMMDDDLGHIDPSPQPSDEERKASDWALKCVESIAKCSCSYHCKCCPIGKRSGPSDTSASKAAFNKAREELRKALSDLPNIDAKKATNAITRALRTFPAIAKYATSPKDPRPMIKKVPEEQISEWKNTDVPRKALSFPCCFIYTETEGIEHVFLDRLREKALLWMDPDELPPLPPSEREKVEKAIRAGQQALKSIAQIRQPSRNFLPNGDLDAAAEQFEKVMVLGLPHAKSADDILKEIGVRKDISNARPTKSSRVKEKNQTDSNEDDKYSGLKRCCRIAHAQYEIAIKKKSSLNTDRQVYDWINNNKDDDELYLLPRFDTWVRYLREARNHLGESKYSPRSGRDTSGSIVRPEEIE